jgi:fructosamine-3-kinase
MQQAGALTLSPPELEGERALLQLPRSLRPRVLAALRESGDESPILRLDPVGGGTVSHARRLVTGRRSYFLKWNAAALPGMFSSEARALELLRSAGARVPEVVAAADAESVRPGFSLQEWIHDTATPGSLRRLDSGFGARIARLHRTSAEQARLLPGYGLDHDNYLAGTPQRNAWTDDWVIFFREQRLAPQLEQAARRGALSGSLRSGAFRLLANLERWLQGVPRQPVLLHGDLHGRNILCDRSGGAVLVDPAAYWGDREVELAHTYLYSEFPPGFYASYEREWPLEDGFQERRDLYNLYPLLVFWNSGAAHYGARVAAVVEWYSRRL